MVEETKAGAHPPTAQEQLNEIADDWSADDGLPTDVPLETVENLCHSISTEVDEIIAGLQENTTFSEREAQAWGLEHTVDEDGERLSRAAIAIYLSVIHGNNGWLARQTIDSYINRAKSKVEKAKQTVGEVTFPNRDEVLTSPQIVWLSTPTVHDLQRLAEPDDQTLNDIVSRLVADAKKVIPVDEFVEGYIDARGKDAIAQLAVSFELLASGTLLMMSHTAAAGQPLPDIVAETDAVEVGDQVFDLDFEETPEGPQGRYQLSIYASDNIKGMSGVSVEQGLEDLRNAVTETTIDIHDVVEVARTRMDAEAVVADAHGDRLHLTVWINPDSPPCTDRFYHIQQIQVDGVEYPAAVTQVDGDHGTINGLVLWRRDADGSSEAVDEGTIAQLKDALDEN